MENAEETSSTVGSIVYIRLERGREKITAIEVFFVVE